jgi:hypothetical protein
MSIYSLCQLSISIFLCQVSMSISLCRQYHNITLRTRNKAAVLTLRNPCQQSSQEHICNIYESVDKLESKCNKITVAWLPKDEDEEI